MTRAINFELLERIAAQRLWIQLIAAIATGQSVQLAAPARLWRKGKRLAA